MTQPFLSTLDHYLKIYPNETDIVNQVRALVRTRPDAFYRTCRVGHITGSAWIISADRQRCLLTHHRKLDRWLQLGGHADGEKQVERVALREAQEESGMAHFTVIKMGGQLLPLDIDIHLIPVTATEPAHRHYDLRYLLVAGPGQPLKISQESNDLRWFSWAEVLKVTADEGIRRMVDKARQVLSRESDSFWDTAPARSVKTP